MSQRPDAFHTSAPRGSAPPAALPLLLLLPLAACTSLPEVEPPVEPPGAFSASGSAPRADRWWEGLDDPALSALVETALTDNFELRTAWDRVRQARAVVRREGAELFPAVDLDGGAGSVWSESSGDGGASFGAAQASFLDFSDSDEGNEGIRRRNDFDLGLTLSYEIDLWGRVRSTRDAARLDALASQSELRAAAVSLSALVASTWYEWVEQHGQVAILDRQIATNEQVLDLVTLRFRTGQAGAADVLRQRQLVEETRGERILVEARARVLRHALAVLVGRPPAERVATPPERLIELPGLPEAGLPAQLIERRPDVRQAYYAVLAADRRLAAARADRYPRISLSASAALGAEALRDLVDNWIATLAANLLQPVFDGGRRAAEVDRTRAVVSERLHAYGDAVLTSLQEVEDALVQERQQRAFIRSLDRQLVLAQQVLERIRDRYLQGAVDYLDVLEALSSQQTLERSRLTAQRDLIDQRIALHRALAGDFALDPPAHARPGAAP